MKHFLFFLLLLVCNHNIFAQEYFIPSDKNGVSFSARFQPDDTIDNFFIYGLTFKTSGNLVLGLVYGDGKIKYDGDPSLKAIGVGLGYIKHVDPKKSKLKISLFPSIFYSKTSSNSGSFSSLDLSLEIFKILTIGQNVFIIPKLSGGFLFSSGTLSTQNNQHFGLGLDSGININDRIILGGHISNTYLKIKNSLNGSISFGLSCSVII